MITVTLTVEELELIDSALDSYEYWEHRDELPHDNGHITIENEDDFDAQIVGYDEEDHGEMREAWKAVKAARALADKLNAAARAPFTP